MSLFAVWRFVSIHQDQDADLQAVIHALHTHSLRLLLDSQEGPSQVPADALRTPSVCKGSDHTYVSNLTAEFIYGIVQSCPKATPNRYWVADVRGLMPVNVSMHSAFNQGTKYTYVYTVNFPNKVSSPRGRVDQSPTQ